MVAASQYKPGAFFHFEVWQQSMANQELSSVDSIVVLKTYKDKPILQLFELHAISLYFKAAYYS